jgi:hypothetical protein
MADAKPACTEIPCVHLSRRNEPELFLRASARAAS